MKNRLFWRVPLNPSAVREAAAGWQVPLWTAELMLRRQVSPQALREGWSWENARTLPDMTEAAALVRNVLERGERVRVHGDYDADGVTATAVLIRGLRALGYGAQVDYVIPNRFDEGYGLSEEAVARAAAEGIHLLVTVDCGSSSPDAARRARELGLTLVITDHHALPDDVPDVPALVNPVRDPAAPPFSGAGVALALMAALTEKAPSAELWGIAAVGTVSDVVPLLGANRVLVKAGLEALRQGRVPGVAKLFSQAGRPLDRASAQDLAFLVGPHLNAAGRMGDAASAIELLLEDDPQRLDALAASLAQCNQERRDTERRIVDEAWSRVPRDSDGRLFPFTVIAGDGWHEGVIGIVASRFKEALRRPVAVIAWNGDEGRGSARGVDGLDLISHMRQSPDLFTKLGGHGGAAGFSLPRQDAAVLSRVLSQNLPQAVLRRQFEGEPFDLMWDSGAPLMEIWQDVVQLEPYGRHFESPRFLVRGRVRTVSRVGSHREHVRLALEDMPWGAIGFSLGESAQGIGPGDPIRFLATLETNWYRGRETPQWRISALEGPAPRQSAPVLVGTPDPVPARTIWVVDSDGEVARTARSLNAQPYHAGMALGEQVLVVEEARRGMVAGLVVSQWRNWPALAGWADAVVWRCSPRSQAKWEEAAALLAPSGQAWLAPARGRAAAKAERLEMSRERLARHWRLWEAGSVGLVPGRAVFAELELTPALAQAGERRPVDRSYLYQMASREQIRDRQTPFREHRVGEDESNGLV